MPSDPIDLIKHIPASARRVLEIGTAPTMLRGIAGQRSPLADVTSLTPRELPGGAGFDCIAIFSDGADANELARLFDDLPRGAQVLVAPEASGPGLLDALTGAGCLIHAEVPVLRAVKADEAPRRVLLHCSIPPQSAADADIRIHRPNAFLRAVPGLRPITEIESFTASLAAPGEARILLLHRSVPRLGRDLEFLQRAVAANYLIVLDLDDDPKFFAELYDDDGFGLRCLHAAQVSTPEIAERLRGQVPEIAVFANQIDFLPPPRTEIGTPAAKNPVKIFFGAYNRDAERAEILDPINRVLGALADQVAVEVVHDREFFEGLRIAAKRFTERCPYPEYLGLLASCDIALLPLLDTPFNRCKSDLKFIECAAQGVAALAAPTVYGQSLADGKTGVLYRDPAEFMVGLQRLIQEPDLRATLTRNAHAMVRHGRMLADHYEARHAWYLDLVANADALRADHRDRAPELYR